MVQNRFTKPLKVKTLASDHKRFSSPSDPSDVGIPSIENWTSHQRRGEEGRPFVCLGLGLGWVGLVCLFVRSFVRSFVLCFFALFLSFLPHRLGQMPAKSFLRAGLEVLTCVSWWAEDFEHRRSPAFPFEHSGGSCESVLAGISNKIITDSQGRPGNFALGCLF